MSRIEPCLKCDAEQEQEGFLKRYNFSLAQIWGEPQFWNLIQAQISFPWKDYDDAGLEQVHSKI